ncbi:hypothetical protein [Methylobacterium marchantiae]|uniref:GlsB/YeaQ/YmgE family stress response membrane protein n=1 Tax=Methylobacterium marchantiae TaxID=600331 RepID=A0ABW3X3S1_9HYPH|nr:hypothetical protein AIGOOFII_1476 [Methylobacterium marchantiae]
MLLLLTVLWPALLASLALGAAIGWHLGPPRSRTARFSAIGLALGALVLAGIALAGFVPGRAGFWVESAALNLAAYCAGAVSGAFAGPMRRSRISPDRVVRGG